MSLQEKRRSNYLSPLGLRVAMRDIIALEQAGQLPDAEREILLVLEEERRAFQQRTTGEEMSVDTYASYAAKLLGVSVESCREAALDVIFPNRAQVAAKVLRAWAKDIKPRKAGQ